MKTAPIKTATVRPSSWVADIPLPANARVNANLGDLFGLNDHTTGDFGVLVESNGVQIVVERATYTNVSGVIWNLGTATLATRLEP